MAREDERLLEGLNLLNGTAQEIREVREENKVTDVPRSDSSQLHRPLHTRERIS